MEGLFGKLERKGAVEDANSSAMGDLCADVGERLSQLEASLGEVRAAEEAARDLTRQGAHPMPNKSLSHTFATL